MGKKAKKFLSLILALVLLLGTPAISARAYDFEKIIPPDETMKTHEQCLKNDNVTKIVYGKSFQGRQLEAYIITNGACKIKDKCKIKCDGSVNVRSGAGTNCSVIATLKNGTCVTRLERNVKRSNGYSWDKITFSKKQTGYIASKYLEFVSDNIKTLFIDFAVHGFEDEYFRDGQVLVDEAYALIDYFSAHPEKLKDYRLVIVPSVNPDGVVAGENNYRNGAQAFGRCTAQHIDINRDFGCFRAIESQRLRDFIIECNPEVYLDMHGWLDEVIGDKALNYVVRKRLDLSGRINHYPTQDGYIIDWVHSTLNIPCSLVEYRSPDTVSTENDIKMIRSIVSSEKLGGTSNSTFPKPVKWSNGSSAERVYKTSELKGKIGTIKAKSEADCYGKIGNAYIVTYKTKGKHKAGFVSYSGGVKSAPTRHLKYKNNSHVQTVYADTGKKTAVGSLDPNEACQCFAKLDNMYLVAYTVSGTSTKKCGFVSYNGVTGQ